MAQSTDEDRQRLEDLEAGLHSFIDTINATGGVYNYSGQIVPVCDQTWWDLGDAYEQACALLGIEMRVAEEFPHDQAPRD